MKKKKNARNFWLKGSKILQVLFRRILPATLQFTEALAARVKSGDLLNRLKSPLKWRRFQTAEEIKENATRQLMAMPKKDFADCLEKWKELWDKCVRSQGQYFEGD